VSPVRYPLVLAAPDGRTITCHDGEHAAAVHLLTDSLLWKQTGRFVHDHGGEVAWERLFAPPPAGAGLYASSEQLMCEAARDLYCGPFPEFATGLKRLCGVLDTARLGRVLEAVCLLRPDVMPPGGWGR
jgi:hypothetical protein